MTLLERWRLLWRDRRRQLMAVAAVLTVLAAAFELGQFLAGYNLSQADTARRRLQEQVAQLKAANRSAAEQLARLETNEKINREAYAQVEHQLAELQTKIIEQQEEVAFYRGIVGGPGQGSLRAQDFSLTAGPTPGTFRLRVVLAQTERAQRAVRGELQVRVEGNRAGRVVSIDLADLSGVKGRTSLPFGFRYFQDIEADLTLPADFTPQRVVLRVTPSTAGVKPSVESFPWSVRST